MPISNDEPLIARDVHKAFGPVVALRGATLPMVPGTVRALLGGNGSGKSTFAKILLGVLAADRGGFELDGRPVDHRGPATSHEFRIHGTFQETSLANDLSVAENLLIGQLPSVAGTWAAPLRRRSVLEAALDRVGLPAAILRSKARDLPLDRRCLVELARVLMQQPRFVILDELTASLRREQVERVGETVRELARADVAVVYVSHRLEEIEAFCDSATVLRNGRTVLDTADLTEHTTDDLLAAMTGKDLAEESAARSRLRSRATGAAQLEVRGLRVEQFETEIDLQVRSGEIVGLAGLGGNGQSEVLRALFGAGNGRPPHVRVQGRDVTLRRVTDAVRNGIGFVSGDREREMSFGHRSIVENLGVVAEHAGRKVAVEPLMQRMRLVAHRRAPMRSLSGGNQQKVIVGRWLGVQPRVLLADDPTRGVDVSTRAEIHRLLRELTDEGSGVLLTSSDDLELAEVCDRVYVLYAGRVVAELTGDAVNEETIGRVSVEPSRAKALAS